jgi:Na+/H+-dicarboxylate symporter
VTFAILLVAGGLIALVVAPPLLARLPLTPEVAARLQASATSAAASTVTSVQQLPTLAQRIVETIPANPIRSAADGAMLPLVIFTLVMALAIARLALPLRESIVGFFSGVSDAMLVIVGWVLAAAPVGVFALSLSVAARTGIQAAGALLFYIVVLSLTLLLVTVMLYVAVLLFGRVSLRAFAVAALPAQAVAMSSRSSLAALPAMMRETRERLGLSPVATSFVLPLAVSVLRMNVPPRWVISAVFLGQLYGVTVGFTSLVWVLVTAVLISFSVPGIPSASLFMLAPVLVSLGLPAEGVGLLIAVDTIPDMFNTLANVTGHMASTAIVAHDDREEALGAGLEQTTARGDRITVGTPP